MLPAVIGGMPMLRFLLELSYVPRYAIVGATTASVDAAMYKYASAQLGEENHLIALAIGAGCGYLINFPGHKLLTFTVLQSVWRQLAWHFPMKVASFSVRFGVMYIVTDLLGYRADLSYVLGLFVGFFTFLGARWIFTRSSPFELLLLIRFWVAVAYQWIKVRLRA